MERHGNHCVDAKPEQKYVGREACPRSEEHTSELQSQSNLVCRLLLEKKKNKTTTMREKTNHNRLSPKIKQEKPDLLSQLNNPSTRDYLTTHIHTNHHTPTHTHHHTPI